MIENCPICGQSTEPHCVKQSRGQDWHIRKCSACGHGFVANRPTLELLKQIYSTEDTHHAMAAEAPAVPFDQRADCISMVRRMTRLSGERGLSLDVGSGEGAFSYHLHKAGFQPVMTDLDPRAEQAAARIAGAKFYRMSFEEFSDTHPGPYAAIVMSQVLEHSLDPMDWLRRAARLLSAEGVLAVALPNFGGIYSLLGCRDPYLIPPVHLNFFTPRSLGMAMESAGLKLMRFDSRSEIPTKHPDRPMGLKRRIIGHSWNAVSWVLNPGKRGIILRGYAGRAR